VTEEPTNRRFLTIEQTAELLNVKASLIRGLIKAGDLRGIQVGGRGYLAQPSGSMPCFAGIQGRRV